jgi:HEAT repeat protein
VPKALADALESESAEIRGAAAAALGHSGVGLDPMISALLRHAEHDPENEVKAICRAVLEVCTRPPKVTTSIIPELIKALENPDEELREALCIILSRFGTDAVQAVPALIRVLKDTKAEADPRYAWIAAEALGDIGPGSQYAEQVVAALIESLGYPGLRGPTSSIRALAGFGPKGAAAIPYLQRLQESNNDVVRDAATEVLAKVREGR